MIPVSGDVSWSDVLVELGFSYDERKSFSDIFPLFNQYNTGASHTYRSLQRTRGFSGYGTQIWHYLEVLVYFPGAQLVIIQNHATVDNQEGTCYYRIYNILHELLEEGQFDTPSIAPQDVIRYALPNYYYPVHEFWWRWSEDLGWNIANAY